MNETKKNFKMKVRVRVNVATRPTGGSLST